MKIFFQIVFATILSGISGVAFSQSPAGFKNYSEHQTGDLRYGFFTPDHPDKQQLYPLVVYLHGSTDTVSRVLSYYEPENQKAYPCYVLTPKCVEPDQGWGNTWRSDHSEMMKKTLALVDSLVHQYHIDTNRLYIYGISMGGFGVFSVLQKNPGKFAAGYAICGGSDERAASVVMKTPLWIFHGAADDVVPVRLSQNIYREIIRLGGKLTRYTEYPGVKHNSWIPAAQEPGLVPWLFAQKKD